MEDPVNRAPAPTDDARALFEIDGVEGRFTLAVMLRDNDEDEHVCGWLRSAKVGDVFDEYHSERVTRVL